MCVDGEVPLGRRGRPSPKVARLVLSFAPASEMRAPCPWMAIAEADRLARVAAMASQVVAL